ncbi:hypothetical protein K439DRAFT_445733 [Ramaria rubella]|nr:hypothetical protein K439DRAFT_445733 [Ramaria rubella]
MDGSPDAQADFQAILDGLIINYVFLSVIVFYGYDILLKMSSEVGFIWGGPKKPRITVSLYITTRYCPLFFVIIQFTPVPSDMKTM